MSVDLICAAPPVVWSNPRRLVAGLAWFALVLIVVSAAVAPAWAQAARGDGSRVALVIANSRYQAVEQLPNAVADGRLVAKALNAVGFQKVILVEDADRATMEKSLRAFSDTADQASVAVIYYAGHGMEINGGNYLVPVDARLKQDRDVELEAVKLDTLLQMSDGARRLRVVILDACRNNPFLVTMKRTVSTRALAGGGLAPVEPKTDSLVVYSAKAGATASDGEGANSPFARSLARRLVEPGREINILFRQIRDDVLAETRGQQEPFTYGSLSHEEFYFVPGKARVSAPLDLEAEAWGLCRDAGSRGPCDTYLRSYAAGRFVSLVGTRIADLEATARLASLAPARPAAAASSTAAGPSTVAIGELGFALQENETGVRVRSIDPGGLAAGELFASDEIIGVDASRPVGVAAVASQITEAVRQRGRVKLLVRRGPTTAVVVLRQPSA